MMKSMFCALLGGMLCCGVAQAQEGSLERVPATGTDLARELGIVMRKFKVRFDKPMHCAVTLKIKHVGSKDMLLGRDRSTEPQKTYDILFSMKDDNLVLQHLGLSQKSEVEDAVKFRVMSQDMGFEHYDKNPFGEMKPGQAFYIWSQRNSTEEIPLDEEIPIFIKAGPYSTDAIAEIKDVTEQYPLAPGFIHMSARFSENEILTSEEIAERIKAAKILQDFDELVEGLEKEKDGDAEETSEEQEEPAGTEEESDDDAS